MESTAKPTPNRKRDILLRVFVTEAERDFIYGKMDEIDTNNFGAYARKMLIDGYAINIDFSDLKTVIAEMQKIGVNLGKVALVVYRPCNHTPPLLLPPLAISWATWDV